MPLGSESAMEAASCWTEIFWLMSAAILSMEFAVKHWASFGRRRRYLRDDLARPGIVEVGNSFDSRLSAVNDVDFGAIGDQSLGVVSLLCGQLTSFVLA